jgi:hypothetical protein
MSVQDFESFSIVFRSALLRRGDAKNTQKTPHFYLQEITKEPDAPDPLAPTTGI